MTTLSEKKIQTQICHYLETMGYLVLRVNSGTTKTGNRYIRNYIITNYNLSSGFPDLVALRGKEFLLIEVKKEKGKLSPGQEYFMRIAKEKHGIETYIIRSVEGIQEILNDKTR